MRGPYVPVEVNFVEGKRVSHGGVVPADVYLSERPAGHGYIDAEVVKENPFFPVGSVVRGHEFHHSRLVFEGPGEFAYASGVDAASRANRTASSIRGSSPRIRHLHALSSPFWGEGFVSAASAFGGFAAEDIVKSGGRTWLKRISEDRR